VWVGGKVQVNNHRYSRTVVAATDMLLQPQISTNSCLQPLLIPIPPPPPAHAPVQSCPFHRIIPGFMIQVQIHYLEA